MKWLSFLSAMFHRYIAELFDLVIFIVILAAVK